MMTIIAAVYIIGTGFVKRRRVYNNTVIIATSQSPDEECLAEPNYLYGLRFSDSFS